MLLIDILNGLNFAGADFDAALTNARRRTRLLNPILRRVMDYAAKCPKAFKARFSPSLLASAAYLLAEAQDPDFLRLAAPLTDLEADLDILGDMMEDSARLIAAAVGSRPRTIDDFLRAGEFSYEFHRSSFEALALIAHWSPELGDEVRTILRSFLLPEFLNTHVAAVRETLAETCCRFDPVDFALNIQIAIDRNALDEAFICDLIAQASQRGSETVSFTDWTASTRMTAKDPFLRQYMTTFRADELRTSSDSSPPNPEALASFNSLAAPCRNYRERIGAIRVTEEVIDVCKRVVRFATTSPDAYRTGHCPISLSAAICLAAPSGEPAFMRQFAALLGLPSEDLERLLGDDLTGMCEAALTICGRFEPGPLRTIVEDVDAYWCSRTIALGALLQQVRRGYRLRDELSDYCRKLIARRAEIHANAWFWTDFLAVCASLALVDLRPTLLKMISEGLYDDDGESMIGEECIQREFENPASDKLLPEDAHAVSLLGCCRDFEAMTVEDFLGRLEPPNFDLPITAEVEDGDEP